MKLKKLDEAKIIQEQLKILISYCEPGAQTEYRGISREGVQKNNPIICEFWQKKLDAAKAELATLEEAEL